MTTKLRPSNEFPFIVTEDVAADPAQPLYEISFLEDLGEAEATQSQFRSRPQNIGREEKVQLYVHIDHVREILERIAKGDVEPTAALLVFKPLV